MPHGQSNAGYFLDGSLFNNPWDNANLPIPFPDALQEFKVETSALTAQNGIHSGASITAVTKSGSNSFHGDAFDFFRNGDMNARNFFAPTRDTLKRNQYGGTIGGPIMRNKLFFFFGYQGTRTRQDPSTTNAFVPTPAMLTGDFSACPTAIPAALASQFTNGKIFANAVRSGVLEVGGGVAPATGPCGNTCGLVTKITVSSPSERTISSTAVTGLFAHHHGHLPGRLVHTFTPNNLLSTGQGGFNDRNNSGLRRHLFVQPHHGELLPRGMGLDRGIHFNNADSFGVIWACRCTADIFPIRATFR